MSNDGLNGEPRGVLRFSGFRRTVADLQRSKDFYIDALGFVVDSEDDHGLSLAFAEAGEPREAACVRLRLGDESIRLVALHGTGPSSDASAPRSAVSDAAFHHLAIVVRDMAAALDMLGRHSPHAISKHGAVRLPESSGGVTAFKFRDPDGHPLELIEFPPGKGDPRWHRASTDSPTVGIDHSAMSVTNLERSLEFYSGVLGFLMKSRQVNRGIEQAALDGVDNAVVEVVGLSPIAVTTPHLELLAYDLPPASPRRSPPALSDDRSDCMAFDVGDLAAVIDRLRQERDFATAQSLELASGVLVRDEDGHLLLLRQAAAPR